MELIRCRSDPWHFMRAWVLTENAHATGNSTFEAFPDKPHLFYLTRLWQNNPRLLVPKSRQLMATWLFTCLYLWDALFFPSRLTFFQSKKEEDADANLERAWTVYKNLPTFIQLWAPARRTFCHIRFQRNRSHLFAVPEGADHARQFTATGYFSDEMAYQVDVDKVIAAVGPTLGKNGRFTGVSSASSGYFEKMVFDKT